MSRNNCFHISCALQYRAHFIRIFIRICLSVRKQLYRHNTEKPCQRFVQITSVGICIMVLYCSFGWIAHLSNLLYCSVLLFTAIEEKHNALGGVFNIHHGETVGFPWLVARTSTQSMQKPCQRQLNCGQNVGRLWSGPQDPAIVEM